jgi:hypothetical protein
MAKSYFRLIPNFDYISRNKGEGFISEYITVKNLFKKGKLREDIFKNIIFFEKYSIIGDERPDNVAFKFYGEETLDWIILLSNNILNVQNEWPLTQEVFGKVMLEKYGSYENFYSGIHHYETEEIKNLNGITILKSGIEVSPTWKTNGNFIEAINSIITELSATEDYDGFTPSNKVTVIMENSIPEITPGTQVTIGGVSEIEYNGQFIVKEVLNNGFVYELPSIPNIINPILSTSKKEQVIYTIPDNALNTGNSYYYEYWDSSLGYTNAIPSTSFIREVTNFEYELNLEEKKRNIFILKPLYLNTILNDIEEIMTYKKGGEQYVSPTLKKGYNIRLYQ